MNLQPSASMEVSKRAGELQKSGIRVFPLSVGDTHFNPPFDIQEKIASLPAAYSHYTLGAGIIELRQEISAHYKGVYTPDEIILTPGLKQGLFCALSAIEGKKLCVLEPAWLGYQALAVLTGKEYCAINTTHDNWQQKLRETEFDVIIICTPNNPDGKILNEEEIDSVIAAASRNNAWIITDEIYDVYDFREGEQVNHIAKVHGLDKAIIGNGLSKSHAMTGFRLGYLMAKDKNLLRIMANIHQNLATCAPAVSQYLALGFGNVMGRVAEFKEYYRSNRNMVTDLFPELSPYKPQGGFYYFVNLAPFGVKDAGAFCKNLLENEHVATVPGDAYGTGFDSYLRLSFSVDKNLLKDGVLRLKKALFS